MTTLIGSRALKFWFPEIREPNDWDYISEEPIEGAETFWHANLSGYDWDEIANPMELYTIKVSHSFWYLHNTWKKHMYDIRFLQSKGYGYLIPELYEILYPIWEERYGKKRVNLNASPEDFFNKNVVRTFDHDSIHRSIAYHDRPLYESILKDGHDVMVDRSKFDALPYEDKLKLVREEVYATALERQVIPSGYVMSPGAAYGWALRKTITDFSKGWFPLFIVENYHLLASPDVDYVKRHKDNADRLIRL